MTARRLCCIVAAVGVVVAQESPARLEFAEKPRLVDCDPASTTPGFRLRLNVVDAQGSPASVALSRELTSNITVRIDDQELTPFYANAGSARTNSNKRAALLVLDVSGSMNARLPDGTSRFDAQRAAAEAFARGMQGSSDEIAVVPFGSHNVGATIRSAKFGSAEAALQQIRNLPAPEPRNNTALYSAVDAGLDVLQGMKQKNPGIELVLLVMTDGRNDVREGDDPGLLQGSAGLDAVAAKVRATGFQVFGIGFGDSRSLDANAMRRISTQYRHVNDPEQLKRMFSQTQTLLRDRLQVTFASPWTDRASLAGRTLPIGVSLKLRNGSSISSVPVSWMAPQIATPVYEDRCNAAEMKAALATPGVSGGSSWSGVLRTLLVFTGLGCALLAFWFWLPRLVWPDEYIGDWKSIQRRSRWSPSKSSAGFRLPSNRQAPPGFGSTRGGPARGRTPSDATTIEPRTAMGTRTRLDLDLPRDRR